MSSPADCSPHTRRRGQNAKHSHEYLLDRQAVIPVLAVLAIASAGFLGVGWAKQRGWIKSDLTLLNPDRAGFDWKRRASARPGQSTVFLSGDSACTTDIDPVHVPAGRWHGRLLNLGLVIDMPLSAYADALERAVAAAGEKAEAAVLVVSPQRLAHTVTGPYFVALWEDQEPSEPSSTRDLWRTVLPFCWLERPVPGQGRLRYGFHSVVRRHLATHFGSFVDPNEYHQGKRAKREDLYPAPDLQAEIHGFRRTWRRRVPLLVALAPLPASYAPLGYEDDREQRLRQFAAAVGADVALEELPGVLPDLFFATPTHLNALGQRWYTEGFARALDHRWKSDWRGGGVRQTKRP